MADPASSLPVRTQTNGDVVTQICDGTTVTQKAAVNSAGSQQVAGQGVAGTPAGGVVSVQGVSGGTAIPVTSATDQFPATQSVTAQDIVTTSSTQYGGQTVYSGTPTAGSSAQFTLSSYETGILEITGTWTGTLQSEISTDAGVTWIAHAIHLIGSSIFSAAFTANATGSLNLAAKTSVRVRATAAWTGSATIKFNFSANPSSVYVANSIKLVDGSSPLSTTTATIKAASIPAATTDTAVVVAVSPNNTIPTNLSQIAGAVPSASNALPTQIATGGSFVSASNPLPVTIDPAAAGTPKNYFTDSSSVAVGSSITQSTTVGGTTGFYLQQIYFSASGKCKAVFQIAGTTFWAGFNSTATPNQAIPVPNNTLIPTGTVISVVMTNNDLASQDLYSTISGFQV